MMPLKPNILVLTNVYPTAATPNKGMDIREQIDRLSPYFEFKVIYARPKIWDGKRYKHHVNVWYDKKIQIFETEYLSLKKVGPFFSGISYYIFLRKLIYSINRAFLLNLMSCYWTYPEGFAASFISRDLNIPLVIRPRGSDINLYLQYFPFRFLIKSVLQKADAIVPVCTDLGNNINKLGIDHNKIYCIPFGVDTSRFKIMDKKSCRDKIGIKPETNAILFIGNLVDVKGVDYLLESLKIIERKKISNLEINIVGSGPLLLKYKNSAKHFKSVRIKFRGEIPNHEIPIWMNASDLFCLPSISEGYPNVLIEALACGLPIVATRVGGIPEIIDNPEFGILVTPKNPTELSESILLAIKRKWERSILIQRSIKNDWQESTNKILSVYEGLLALHDGNSHRTFGKVGGLKM